MPKKPKDAKKALDFFLGGSINKGLIKNIQMKNGGIFTPEFEKKHVRNHKNMEMLKNSATAQNIKSSNVKDSLIGLDNQYKKQIMKEFFTNYMAAAQKLSKLSDPNKGQVKFTTSNKYPIGSRGGPKTKDKKHPSKGLAKFSVTMQITEWVKHQNQNKGKKNQQPEEDSDWAPIIQIHHFVGHDKPK